MVKAVVFDCDGVLVDSEDLAWDAWRQILAEHGIELTIEDEAVLTGRTEQVAYEHFAARGALPPYEEFWPQLAEAVTKRFEEHLGAFEDALLTLRALRVRETPVAVASSSPRQRLDLALRRTGLIDLVEVTVAGDEVGLGKPAPDLFLEAAARLGLEPSQCLAVEDSPAGVEAAVAAGMEVVAVARGRYDPDLLSGALVVVDRLSPEMLDLPG